MAPLVLNSSHLETTNPTNNLGLGPAMPTKPTNRKTRRKALRTLRAALKYLGYSIRYVSSAAIAWANNNPKIVMGVGLVIIGSIVVITFPEAAAPVLGAFGFSAVRSVVAGAIARGVEAGIDALFGRAGPSKAGHSKSKTAASESS